MVKKFFVAVGTVGVLVLAGCSGGSSESAGESSASAPPSAAPSAASTSAEPIFTDGDGGCSLAEVDGSTQDSTVQALATEVYEALECGTGESLEEQMRTVSESEALARAAEADGVTITLETSAGNAIVQVVDAEGESTCTVTAIDALNAKSLSCLDL